MFKYISKIIKNITYYLKQKALYNRALGLAYKHGLKWNKAGAYRIIRNIRSSFGPNIIDEKELQQVEKYLLTRK